MKRMAAIVSLDLLHASERILAVYYTNIVYTYIYVYVRLYLISITSITDIYIYIHSRYL